MLQIVFEPVIPLGSAIHLVVLVAVVLAVARFLSKALGRIEKKQDAVLKELLKKHEEE